MLNKFLLTSAIVLGVALSGCAGKGNKGGADARPTNDSGLSTGAYDPNAVSGNAVGSDDISGLSLAERTVYFAYDSSDLTSEGQAIVARFARYLAANPSARLRLEGNADERGTREYNVGLGERRANAVQAALTSQGASPSQLTIVSYGEERPSAPGHDESAYSLNRRVEIVQI